MTSGTSRLLYVRRPLVLNPELAEVLDSGDLAITLQQVEYWMGKTDNKAAGHKWVYNSIPQWAEQFPWSESTTKRHFRKLRDMGLLITGRFGKTATDRTLWYRIDYEALDRLDESKDRSYQAENATGQNDPMKQVKMTRSIRSNWSDVNKELTETTSEIIKREESEISEKSKFRNLLKMTGVPDSVIQEVIGSLNFDHASAAFFMTAACANGNHVAYLSKTLRNWGKYPSEAVTGLKQARSVWVCGECETHNYRATMCGGCRAERDEVGTWAIPRET